MSYLKFIDAAPSPSGKTKRWVVQTATGVPLMGIGWHGPWRKYTITWTDQSAVFDHGCLREIADFLEARTKEHKA